MVCQQVPMILFELDFDFPLTFIPAMKQKSFFKNILSSDF